MKTDLFQSCGHCWVFQICWHIEYSTLTASFSRIWNSSTGIPSPPLALFSVMLPKAHLTSHSGCLALGEWSHHHDYLGGEDLFCSSSVYSFHLFLISPDSFRSLPFLFFIEAIFAWNLPLVSRIFLKRSLVFPILLFSSISLHWSLRKTFLSLLAILCNSAFRLVYLSFSHITIIIFMKLLLRPYYVSDTFQDKSDTKVKKINENPCLHGTHIIVEEGKKKKNKTWSKMYSMSVFFYLFKILFFKCIFNQRIIALQCCVGFYCTTWVSNKYTYIPSLLSLPPTPHSIAVL